MHLSENLTSHYNPARTRALAHPRILLSFTLLLLFLLALVPRIGATGDFWTADEAKHWSVRAEKFVRAMHDSDYAQTNLVGHPGVTTMWLGAAGAVTYQFLADQGYVVPATPALDAILDSDYGRAAEIYSANPDDFARYRWLLRLPVSIVTSLSVVVAYLLLWRLLGQRVALLSAILLATDPFLVAHGRTLHVDALLTTFMLLALLMAMAAFRTSEEYPTERLTPLKRVRWPLFLGSAVMGGLAVLTKSPSILLLPMIGLSILNGVTAHEPTTATPRPTVLLRSLLALIPTILVLLLVWLAFAALTWVALWPAAWVDLSLAVTTVVNEVSRNGAQPHSWGNFFMGRVVGDPGPIFYAVAIAIRLTPWLTIGLIAIAIAVVSAALKPRSATPLAQTILRPDSYQLRVMGLLACFALIFIFVMSIPAKKFDRYALPIFPVLNILGAAGLLWLFDIARRWTMGRREQRSSTSDSPAASRHSSLLAAVCWLLITIITVVNLAWYHPYQLAYYNPLLGGGPVGARTLFTGWGEGLEQAGAYITSQPNGCDHAVGSWYELAILPYVCSAVMELNWSLDPGRMDYVVLYINQVQRNIKSEAVAMALEQGALVHTVRIHGIDYASVYQLPQPTEHYFPADFGPAIHLTGYEVDTADVRATGVLTLTVQWQARAPIVEDYMLFVHVFDDAGNLVAQTDVPPAGPHVPTSTWQFNHFVRWFHPVHIAADVPPGTYWIALGIYHPDDFSRLPLHGPVYLHTPDDGPNALFLAPITIP